MTVKEATPLFVAACYGFDKIVRYLLDKGADVSAKTSNVSGSSPDSYGFDYDYHGLTPLYAATMSDQHFKSRRSLLQQQEDRSNIVRMLLEFGANPISDSFRPFNGQLMWLEEMCGVDSTAALYEDFGLPVRSR